MNPQGALEGGDHPYCASEAPGLRLVPRQDGPVLGETPDSAAYSYGTWGEVTTVMKTRTFGKKSMFVLANPCWASALEWLW